MSRSALHLHITAAQIIDASEHNVIVMWQEMWTLHVLLHPDANTHTHSHFQPWVQRRS